jgi:hypothetical protein
MSIKIMSWVWDNSPYEGKALLIHLAMADFANDEGLLWPSQATLAKKSRSTDRHVRDVISGMERDGLVELVTASNGRDAHKYRLLARNSVPPEVSSTRNSTTLSPELGDNLPGNPAPKNRKNHQEPSLGSDQKPRCPYCKVVLVATGKHHCSAMNQLVR